MTNIEELVKSIKLILSFKYTCKSINYCGLSLLVHQYQIVSLAFLQYHWYRCYIVSCMHEYLALVYIYLRGFNLFANHQLVDT